MGVRPMLMSKKESKKKNKVISRNRFAYIQKIEKSENLNNDVLFKEHDKDKPCGDEIKPMPERGVHYNYDKFFYFGITYLKAKDCILNMLRRDILVINHI